ncbi:MAG: WD domain-containing protein, G-beta repeat-containing protein [Candidatus Kentron sp. G]|nr:MAG: WD domain-containing protein, G-beta repeat-containing protein [Candidatus Kentron sp. G]VFM95428.1 MAG: WD domain-containing protein, G-beta repeat-containing protein [Candidatus Kentron sp. G]VFM97347.1 MAG: WD domain-containing protein, G-beta repeat-containing protein [Candidatus Kentron sp. G]
MAFSPDGRTLATAGYDGKVGLYEVETGEGRLFEAHQNCQPSGCAEAVGFLDGNRLMSAGYADQEIRFWHMNTWPPTPAAAPLKSRDAILWASLRPDAQQLAAVGREYVVKLHGLPAPGASTPMMDPSPRQLVGHEQTVFRAEYTPDGAQLATVSSDMTLRLWDLGNDKPLFTLRLPTEFRRPSPLWDFALGCLPAASENTRAREIAPHAGHCWLAVPLTVGRLALYRLPYNEPPLGAQ